MGRKSNPAPLGRDAASPRRPRIPCLLRTRRRSDATAPPASRLHAIEAGRPSRSGRWAPSAIRFRRHGSAAASGKSLAHDLRDGSRTGSFGNRFSTSKWLRGKTHLRRSFSDFFARRPKRSKNPLSFFQKLVFSCAVPPRMRGVSRSSRTLSAGCDGRVRLQRAWRADEQHDAHGEIVRSWPPGAGVKLADSDERASDGGNQAGPRGDHV